MLKCGDKVEIIHSKFTDHAFKKGDTVYFIGVILDEGEPVFIFTNGECEQGLYYGEFELQSK